MGILDHNQLVFGTNSLLNSIHVCMARGGIVAPGYLSIVYIDCLLL